jgi:RimJ/RimL family protein N-acetyltransferase
VARLSLPALRTDRLRLEPVGDDHLPLLVELNADPQVMRFITGRSATPASTRAEWASRLGERTDVTRGLGYWAGHADGAFVGWWGASSVAEDPSVSVLGYRLRRDAWGRGYATEGARAMVAQAFTAVETVAASTMAVNTGSRAVLTKAGLRHTRTWVQEWEDPIPGWERGEVYYERSRPPDLVE